MRIQSIPMWEGKGNNYAYLVVDDETRDAVVVDPANAVEVLPVLKEEIDSGRINLVAIVNTHHHRDHSGGNETLLSTPFLNPSPSTHPLPIIGGASCPFKTITPANNSTFPLSRSPSNSVNITALYTPCHTQDSICWYIEDPKTHEKVVFTGDTLFHGGCGKFFEGTAKEMDGALTEILGSLPEETLVFPGHEYTLSNTRFALSVDPNNAALKRLHDFSKTNKHTQGRFTIRDEKAHNVFMRVREEEMREVTGRRDPVEVMARLREMKNTFQ